MLISEILEKKEKFRYKFMSCTSLLLQYFGLSLNWHELMNFNLFFLVKDLVRFLDI